MQEEKKLNRRETFKARLRPYDYFVNELIIFTFKKEEPAILDLI